ncbi:putative RNA recognition motif domain, nucleotide-binding alpha-beta plait domain superfamily [Helianthus annuus]|uniref:RNA recognition motif domain, nucleotide-binding alpha-beta plait domain superfamily n=1 Tax=Helianthus annuus TaxID=4232 RepID=A0A9K3I4C8_HELAN|nr:putative RNA recognition motif domain, nucleotide-binding alpha-beta plait domain superfamily [Helianthus annuus]KAJ0533047.1 putative RNA recognition motif domain, nucleotide-binding alpha-beta plait domain superfamily [Helianthus annuus]KAJ0541413.1 putative RNA recognition motif domain, nucleotide-binding alpha-beta plait domain superfamily [Helianthus annuus]KAJ0706493.1 putative RNA recognition motif domain, nucleotide-binding alpha-beta plait domain superfamily [Helianthus annuus]KAJ07
MEANEESWEVQNRSRRGRGAAVGLKPEVTKFFVTNIPQGCRPWDLANVFIDYGEIASAFIAKKKDKDRRIFGFVSFKGVRDLEELKNNLSKVKLGGNKLVVNVALFVKENGVFKSSVAYGGVAKNAGFNELWFLKLSLKLAGFEGASLQYLGGLSVLISFNNGYVTKRLLDEREVWNCWFSSLSPWLGQSLPYESLAWVNILGVPPLTFDRLGILLDTGNRINGVLSLSWQDKRYKVWVVEENDQWIPDFLEDNEDSVVASSELGGNLEVLECSVLGNCGMDDKEDEELGGVPAEEVDKSKEIQWTFCDVHASMQREKEGGGNVSKDKGEQFNGYVGHDSLFNSNVGPSSFQVGEVDLGESFSFKVGKSNYVKPNKVRMVSPKIIRPNNSYVGSDNAVEDWRPQKRFRSFMEGGCNSGGQAKTEGKGAMILLEASNNSFST